MNKAAIKKELRRSACEDEDPWKSMSRDSFNEAGEYCWPEIAMAAMRIYELRIYLLFIAEAL